MSKATKKEEIKDIEVINSLDDLNTNEVIPVTLYRAGKQIKINVTLPSVWEVEELDAALPYPEVPMKACPENDVARRRAKGLPLEEPDYENKEYLDAVTKRSDMVNWGVIRKALAFADDKGEPLEEWMNKAKKKFLPSDIQQINEAIQSNMDINRLMDNERPI